MRQAVDASQAGASPAGTARQRFYPAIVAAMRAALRGEWLVAGPRAGGVLVAALATLLMLAFHFDHPNPFIPYHDTWEYVRRANIIASGGPWADPARLPGYPLLLAPLFLVAGKGNLAAANGLQDVLFVLAAVAVYVLAYRVWRQTRVALIVGALFATNIYFLSYVKPILSDGLALLLTLLLALAVVGYLERPRARRLWLVAALLLALIMTRAEWELLPVPLFAFLVFAPRYAGRYAGRYADPAAGWSGRLLARTLAHAAGALAVIYAAIGGYIWWNARVNGFAGLTDASNINFYGKVTQYNMQNMAPARYDQWVAVTDRFVAKGIIDPWVIYWHDRALGSNHFAGMGAYARAVLLGHPLAFLSHSAATAFESLSQYKLFAQIYPGGHLARALGVVQSFSALVFPLFMLFPIIALIWWVALLRRGGATLPAPVRRRTLALCALSLLALYDLAMTSLGSYDEYTRLHLGIDPLMLIVIVGSILLLGRGSGKAARRVRGPTEDDIAATAG